MNEHEKWAKFLNAYSGADDRSCAILFGSYLESETIDSITRVAVHSEHMDKKLIRGAGPLSSFSARIDLLFAFGLVEENVFKDLHLIRKIRNKFAHEIDIHTFGTEPIMSWVNELILPKVRSEARTFESLRGDYRTLFIVSGALCQGALRRVEAQKIA